MKLLFKQRFFSWFDSYDIYYENGQVAYTVKGELAWGHQFRIYDSAGNEVGGVRQRILTFLPKYEIYHGDSMIGCISKELSLFRPKFDLDFKNWYIEGDFFEWDYSIMSGNMTVATVSKELLNWTDTYIIDVKNPEDGLYALMVVLAIDAEKCSRN